MLHARPLIVYILSIGGLLGYIIIMNQSILFIFNKEIKFLTYWLLQEIRSINLSFLNNNFKKRLLMFILVEYVSLSQGYIRGQFVLHQRQSFIEEPLVYRLSGHFHCDLWVQRMWRIYCVLLFQNKQCDATQKVTLLVKVRKFKRQVLFYLTLAKFMVIKSFLFSDIMPFLDLWVANTIFCKKTHQLCE